MKNLTLKTLTEAIETITTSKRFENRPAGTDLELLRALNYMNGQKINEPRDPREVLAGIGYKF